MVKGEVRIRVGGEEIMSHRKVEYLSVWLDQGLTLAENVERIVEKDNAGPTDVQRGGSKFKEERSVGKYHQVIWNIEISKSR